jgi:putative addiction module killer protein
MLILERTADFDQWLNTLKDVVAQKRILARLERLAEGNWGDCKAFDGMIELRFHLSGGYRIYCWQSGDIVVLLLCVGNKSSQLRDIAKAKKMIKLLEE